MRRARAKLRRHVPGEMNQTERKFVEEVILPMKEKGDIHDWWFERFKFKLADNTYYTPDFVIQNRNGELEVWEVKGGGGWQDDARVKVKVLQSQFPFFVTGWVGKSKKNGGGWEKEEFFKEGNYEL